MRATSVIAIIAQLAVAASCGGGDAARPDIARVGNPPGVHIDSALPLADQLARFRLAAGPRVDTLRGAATSISALVDQWAAAVAARDTAALVKLAIDRAEFAWLYYPGTSLARPPYEMPPGLLWSQLIGNSDEGLRKALQVLGGLRIRVRGVTCPAPPEREGEVIVRQQCTVALRVDGDTIPEARYFGSIVERGGRFKFLSHANRL